MKLSFVDEYAPVALQATETKLQRYFLDLFAGPGLNVSRRDGSEFQGSPLRALQLCGHRDSRIAFTHLVAVNWLPIYHDALSERVQRLVTCGTSRIPHGNIHLHCGDTRQLLPSILDRIPERAYVLAFADIQGVKEWPYSAVQSLRTNGHTSVDLCMLFPLEMTIARLLSVSAGKHDRFAEPLTDFFGTEEWRALARLRITDAQSPVLRASLIDLYLRQLRRHWRHALSVRDVRMRGNRILYRLLFASNHDAGAGIARWAAGVHDRARQTELF